MNINPSSGKRIISDVVAAPKKEIASQLFREPALPIKTAKNPRKKKAVFVVFAAVLILLVWGFAGVKLSIVLSPKTAVSPVNKTFNITRDSANKGLTFKTLALEYTRSEVFQATEKKLQESRAEGVVVIFNGSYDPQILVGSTRLESPAGKIYRIPRTIVVPGAKTESGKTTPGSIEISVSADKPGEEYNLGLSDFTVPGLKGSTRYELVFARSKTEIRGGSSGEQLIVGKEDIAKASSGLIAKAKQEAARRLADKVPPNEFLLASSVEFLLTKETASPAAGTPASSDGKFSFTIEGEARGAILPKIVLEEALLKDASSFPEMKTPVRLTNLEELDFNLMGYKFDSDEFAAKISGKMEIKTIIDEEEIREFLSESRSLNAGSVLDAFPAIARVEIKIRPFWIKPVYQSFKIIPRRIDIILEES